MRPLSAAELLNVWERGAAQQPAQRALALLAASCSDTAPEELAGLSVGVRDARLLRLREWTFGTQLSCVAACPGCDQRLELDLAAGDLRARGGEEPAEELSLTASGFVVRFRLPNSRDLVTLA
ncbi:MAG: phage baseplate protein, partial [Acidobacteriota bacterium]|nr:phage baseplate protein [Acidobacteriota bacterium]